MIERLLRFREHFSINAEPVPKTIRLNKDKVEQLKEEFLQYCPSMVGVTKILGMRIIV